MKTTTASTQTDPVVQSLAKFLANSYALMAQTQLAHWNVEGSDFFALHAAFQKQYEDLFEAVDEIAERIRALGHYAEGGLERFAAASELSPMPAGRQPAKDFVAQLIDGHEKLVSSAKVVEDASAAANDLETQDLAIKRRQEHEKTLWMLNAVLK